MSLKTLYSNVRIKRGDLGRFLLEFRYESDQGCIQVVYLEAWTARQAVREAAGILGCDESELPEVEV